jgi:uncharacterized cupredoxin-like copper-binding protein
MFTPAIARHALVVPFVLATLAGSALPRVSHAAPARAAVRTIVISSSRLSFPKSIPAGMLALRLVTDGRGQMDAGIARINPGVKMSDVRAANAKGDFMRLTQLVTFLGGVGLGSRSTGTAILDLRTPGRYGLHIQHGDQGPGTAILFTVTPSSAQATAPMPKANLTVNLGETGFAGLSRTLHAGTITFKVTNHGSGVRDMLLYRVDPGKTVRDMIAAMKVDERTGKDPSWAHNVANLDVLSPQQTMRVTVSLAPGSYVALCPLPDPNKGGEALALEGMIVPFTVV